MSAIVAAEQQRERRISPLERLTMLCDPGTLHVLRSDVRSRALGPKARAGDGVVGGIGAISGRPVCCYAQDSRFAGGSLGTAGADTIVRVQQQARRAAAPVIALVESGGARMQEGVGALSGYARIFRENVRLSGFVPQISVVTGTAAGGGCYSPALTDVIILAKHASMFLTGPGVVREITGEHVSAAELGGSGVHERNGVCHLVAPTHLDAIRTAPEVLSYLPQNADAPLPLAPPQDPVGGDPGALVPAEQRSVYDVRAVARAIVDGAELLELSPRWARNMVTAFARLNGHPIGVIANQPRYIGGVIDCAAAMKGARFVRMCNAYGLPLVVLVDTPGFMPGTQQEEAGIIRHGAKLLYAFAEATVPKVTVILRKAYGGAYISMNSKDLGADFAFAWPNAQIGIMSAKQAVQIIHSRKLASGTLATAWEELVAEYEDAQLRARVAAREGNVDDIIEPRTTRERLLAAFGLLTNVSARQSRPGNIPL